MESQKKDKKQMGKRNRRKGHDFERKIVNEFIKMGWGNACTSRAESRNTDNKKIDICYTEPYNIQCKVTQRAVYTKILKEMPADTDNINVLFQKVKSDGEYVIIKKEDFYKIIDSKDEILTDMSVCYDVK